SSPLARLPAEAFHPHGPSRFPRPLACPGSPPFHPERSGGLDSRAALSDGVRRWRHAPIRIWRTVERPPPP
ncbi:MAG: hypothetical protein LBT40_04435, partial [Deltaproteobacteria bacterium]|nr:hypothetical protein [Deltaproteobacteria bacterium]